MNAGSNCPSLLLCKAYRFPSNPPWDWNKVGCPKLQLPRVSELPPGFPKLFLMVMNYPQSKNLRPEPDFNHNPTNIPLSRLYLTGCCFEDSFLPVFVASFLWPGSFSWRKTPKVWLKGEIFQRFSALNAYFSGVLQHWKDHHFRVSNKITAIYRWKMSIVYCVWMKYHDMNIEHM